MKRSVKILSGLLAVLALALCVAVLLLVIGWPVSEPRMQEWLLSIRRFPAALLTILAALLIGALGGFTLYSLYAAHFLRQTSAVIEKNAIGEASVAFRALEDMANTAAKAHGDVKSSRTKVTSIGDQVRINVRVVTAPTVSLVALTHALQDEITAQIQNVCGVSVGRVDVTVDQTEEEPKPSRIK